MNQPSKHYTPRLRAISRTLLACVAVLALGPASSQAASYVLRPTSTQALQTGWSVTPSSTAAHVVLSKAVLQPAIPDTSSYLTAGPGSAGRWAGVGLETPPAFGAGETLTTTTAWAYLSTTASQTMSLSLWMGNFFFGYTMLGSTTVAAGQPAGWHSVSTTAALSTYAMRQLAVGLQPSGAGTGSTVDAAYVKLDTSGPTPIAPPTAGPAAPAAPISAAPPSPLSIPARAISLSARAKDVPVTLTCAPNSPHGCQGDLVLSRILPGSPRAPARTPAVPGKARPRALASRCARGCRTLGHTHFNILAGRSKRVKVHLAHSASSLFGRHHSIKIRATSTISDATGHPQTTSTTLTLTSASKTPPPAAAPKAHGPPAPQRSASPSQDAPHGLPQLGGR